MNFGKLRFEPVEQHYKLVAPVVQEFVEATRVPGVMVGGIDAGLADTAAFCEHYEIGLEVSANCVIVEARRADKTWYAACIILASNRADVNGVIRRQLDARKISFAAMDTAVSLTQMEYGGITPLGLPADWPVLVDTRVAEAPLVVIGSGVRGSKLLVPGRLLADLGPATVLDIAQG